MARYSHLLTVAWAPTRDISKAWPPEDTYEPCTPNCHVQLDDSLQPEKHGGVGRREQTWKTAMNTLHELTSNIDPFLKILAPASRSPDVDPEEDLYGFFIGSWVLDLVAYPDDESVTYSTGEAHCAWVLDGRAIQDVFVNPERSDRTPDSPKFGNWYGTTFRYFDQVIRAWRVFWFNPDDGVRAELVGRRRGSEIVQEGHFPDGTPIRWTFSEITHDSCRWRGERLEPDGKAWRLQVEFRARRV